MTSPCCAPGLRCRPAHTRLLFPTRHPSSLHSHPAGPYSGLLAPLPASWLSGNENQTMSGSRQSISTRQQGRSSPDIHVPIHVCAHSPPQPASASLPRLMPKARSWCQPGEGPQPQGLLSSVLVPWQLPPPPPTSSCPFFLPRFPPTLSLWRPPLLPSRGGFEAPATQRQAPPDLAPRSLDWSHARAQLLCELKPSPLPHPPPPPHPSSWPACCLPRAACEYFPSFKGEIQRVLPPQGLPVAGTLLWAAIRDALGPWKLGS